MQHNNILEALKRVPISVVTAIMALSFMGLFMMYVAGGGDLYPYAYKQLIFFGIFFVIAFFVMLVDLKFVFSLSYLFYLFSLLLLILVEIMGHKAMGATRWISLGFIKMQPSELMKIALVLALSKYFHSLGPDKKISIKNMLLPIFLILLPTIVIMKQPDLGTAMIILIVGVVMLFLAGIRVWVFIVAAFFVLVSAPVLWSQLHQYQKKRVETFLNPESDPLGSGYNIIQSKIAIGSGGLFGKGFLAGTQAQLEFLPEHQTDFVFPMFAEEFGYLGALIILSMYMFLMVFGIKVANNCKHIYGRLLAFGLTSIFIYHVFINLCMVMGILPVVGIPLPFMSYGGTILGATLLIFAIIINIHINKKIVLPKNEVNYFF